MVEQVSGNPDPVGLVHYLPMDSWGHYIFFMPLRACACTYEGVGSTAGWQ